MPRRIYTYDAGQGWEIFNMMSDGRRVHSAASPRSSACTTSSRAARAARSPATIRGARRTLEWSIPSPPPEYNFATIPTVTSRYPLWDMKSPELTTDVPHSRAWRRAERRRRRRKHVGSFHDHMSAGTPEGGVNPNAHQASTKVSLKTAEELGHSDALSDDQAAVRRAVHDADVRAACC